MKCFQINSILCTYLPKQQREYYLKGRSSVDISLFEDSYTSVYDEADMTYGNEPKNHIAHSVTSINTDGNWERTVETPDTWLQGRVAGLNVIRLSLIHISEPTRL